MAGSVGAHAAIFTAPRVAAGAGRSVPTAPRAVGTVGRMGEYSYTERDGHLLVTINRPEVMNALHPPANGELADVFDEFAADPDLWVAIVTGAGERAFSAGNDLKNQAVGRRHERQPDDRLRRASPPATTSTSR